MFCDATKLLRLPDFTNQAAKSAQFQPIESVIDHLDEARVILGQTILCIPTDLEEHRCDQARFDGSVVGEKLSQTSFTQDGFFTADMTDLLFDVARHNLPYGGVVETVANERLMRRHSRFELRYRRDVQLLIFKSVDAQTLELKDEIAFALPE